jgi:hypothetical protein
MLSQFTTDVAIELASTITRDDQAGVHVIGHFKTVAHSHVKVGLLNVLLLKFHQFISVLES